MKDFVIKNGELKKYNGNGGDVIIPEDVTSIGKEAFIGCHALTSATIPNSVTKIGEKAFEDCINLVSVTIPDGVKEIGAMAFEGCENLISITIPDGVKEIGIWTFNYCTNLISAIIPDSVTEIGIWAFSDCPNLTVICGENSATHQYCKEKRIPFLFDYQYASFHGTIPSGLEMLASPFLADEEKPYIFISYSHKDRDSVLPILKTLYEAGWKIWYDEGLTIGDSYDLVLENHVKNCSAFLLFVTSNSLVSHYIEEHEIPWAKQYEKPIIKCILEEGEDYEINDAKIVDMVKPGDIEPALEKVDGLAKGEKREAKGITVAVDPAARDDHASGDGFAYCLYAKESKADAKTILHDIKDGGAVVYDADEEGEDEEKLGKSSCLIVFLDKAFFFDSHLTNIFTEVYKSGKDIAVCLLDVEITLPTELEELNDTQWLNYACKVPGDLNKKLLRHLEKRGCRNTSVIPGFEYKKTEDGIVITRYTGHDPCPRLEREYGGVPVVKIAGDAFENLNFIKEFTIPDSITSIGRRGFYSTSLVSVTIPDSVTIIGEEAFRECNSLTSVTVPGSVAKIAFKAFSECQELTTAIISNGVVRIDEQAFYYCTSLASVTIPNTVASIGWAAFRFCNNLKSITFTGTQSQWKEVEKEEDWNRDIGDCIVHCTDGNIILK